MHPGAYNFIRESAYKLPPRKFVLEYGGRNINGSIRSLFDTSNYLSIDLLAGPGVDLVADASTFDPRTTSMGLQPDTIVCCEVLEHTPKWPAVLAAAGRVLDPETGVLLLTCATDHRAPHSSLDGGDLRPGEYYRNIPVWEFTTLLDQYFEEYDFEVDEKAGDLYVLAWKSTPATKDIHEVVEA